MSLDCPFLLNESYLKGLDYNKVEIILFIFGKEIHVLNKLNYKETQTSRFHIEDIHIYLKICHKPHLNECRITKGINL